jgi:hypothetical protein
MRIHTLTYLLALAIGTLSNAYAQQNPVAVGGVIDLSGHDFRRDGPVELKGEYEFYWNQMLEPSDDGYRAEMSYIQVPGSWYNLKLTHPEIERYGFATYRLVILLPPRVDAIALKITDVFSASDYILNGKAIDFLGFPGVNKYRTVINRPMVTGSVNSSTVELIIHVSNYEHRLSGIVGGITLDLPDQMQQTRDRDLFRGHFLIGAFLIIGVYFLGLYLIRSEHYRLYFSIICVLMAGRVMIVLDLPVLENLN